MRVIDLHCDTIGEMYDAGLGFSSERLDINSRILDGYDEYIPVTAVWSRCDLSGEECYRRFHAVCDNAENSSDSVSAFSQSREQVFCAEI